MAFTWPTKCQTVQNVRGKKLNASRAFRNTEGHLELSQNWRFSFPDPSTNSACPPPCKKNLEIIAQIDCQLTVRTVLRILSPFFGSGSVDSVLKIRIWPDPIWILWKTTLLGFCSFMTPTDTKTMRVSWALLLPTSELLIGWFWRDYRGVPSPV